MDPSGQPQLTDNEQIMLGAQQAALLQQMHDEEIESKVIQQQHLIQEEKILEAQNEALAIQQMQQVAEHQQEAELHHLQTIAMIEKEREQQLVPQPPPAPIEAAVIAGPPPVIPGPMPPLMVGQGPPMNLPPPQSQPVLSQPPPQQAPPTISFTGTPMSAAPPIVSMPPIATGPQAPQNLGQPPPQNLGQPPPQNLGPPPPQSIGPPPPQNLGQPLPQNLGQPPPQNLGQPPPQNLGQPPPQAMQLPPPSSGGPTPLMSLPPINPVTTVSQGPPTAISQGPPPTLAQGPPPTLSQGPPPALNQGPPPNLSQGPPPPLNQGLPPPLNQGPPPPLNQGMPPQGLPPPQGMPPPNLNQGPNLGPGPNMNQMGGPGPNLSGPPPNMGPGPSSGPNLGPGSFGNQGPPPSSGPPPLMSQPIPPHVVSQAMQRAEQREAEEEARKRDDDNMPSGPGPSAPGSKREIKLPQALEKVLAFKGVRAQQMGVRPEDVERIEKGGRQEDPEDSVQVFDYSHSVTQDDADDNYTEETVKPKETNERKESKNKKRKKKKKRARARRLEEQQAQRQIPISHMDQDDDDDDDDVEIEYVPEGIDLERTDPGYSEFARIFQAFQIAEDNIDEDKEKSKKIPIKEVPIKARGLIEDDDDDDDDLPPSADDDKPKMSKKKMKKMNRLSVAELKQLVARPDVVEMHDVTARDPKLLVHIKATRNSVPVPRHWCFKRKYLQGKRGIEKPPFDLPHFIKATGIMEMRQALQDKEDQKTMKSKMRERVRPKMGKIDIDYQKLHDAFFKWQTKPKLSIHGDLYYEGKEFETRLKEKKPGNISDDLRTALGMPIGGNADQYPPPWLIAQQRYGPPPSYPNLKIPGLNAPIPDNCAFGYHAGGWGKPPVDETGKPLYGDVFGTQTINIEQPVQDEDIDKSRWGELESESEEEESEEEDQEDEEPDAAGLVTPGDAGLITPSGVTSVPVGMETPDMIELRKRRIEDAMDQGGDTPALYQVLPERKAAVGGAMMGSAHVYDITAAVGAKKPGTEPKAGGADGVEVALNPDELDLDSAAMQAKYEQTVREQQSQLEKEDLSDMVAEHAAKQQKKRKKQAQDGKSTKKYKEFKF